jgi:SAM-dependent methyltransferase
MGTLVNTSRRAVHTARRRTMRGRQWAMRAWLDVKDERAGTRNPLLPPRRLGLPSQLAGAGIRLVDVMAEAGGMTPDSQVLDVGCGPGRMAAVLTERLSPSATYEGFDVMPKSIAWCRKAISSRFPNFHFQVADLHNGQYNPKGSQRACEYVFPYEDGRFDVAVAGSLYTHLRPFEAQRYLEETARVLRPGGRFVGTWFLLNEEADAALAAGKVLRPGLFSETKPPLRLEHHLTDERGNPFRSLDPETPEYMIAVDEQQVRDSYERAGLRILEIRHGRWAGRTGDDLPGQDVIVAERPTAA